MNEPLDFRELRALVVTSRTGSITGAAQELNIGQPDLTRSLHKLEVKLGVDLFVRHPRGVRLTRAGAIMAEQAQVALELLRKTVLEINVSGDTMRSLAVPPSRQTYISHRNRQEPFVAA